MAGKNKKMNGNRSGRSKRNQKRSPQLWVAPFPPLKVSRTKYCETVALTEGAAGTGFTYLWTPSSLFDPNSSGTGHQPLFYDQLCTSTGPYTRYRALHTRAIVTFTSLNAQATQVGAYVSASLSGPATLYAAMEKPWGKWSVVPGNTSGKPYVRFVIDIPHDKAMGVTRAHLKDDDNYAGYYNASPGINFGLWTWMYGLGGSVSSVSLSVEFDTTSEFFSVGNTGTS